MSAIAPTAAAAAENRPRPAQLPRVAGSFLLQVCLAAVVAAAATLVDTAHQHVDLRLLLVLALAGGAAHSAATHVPRNQVFHTGLAVAFAAVLLLPPAGYIAVCVVPHAIDWVRNRYSWYIQTFNIANFVLDASVAWLVKTLLAAGLHPSFGSSLQILQLSVAGAAFVGANHLLLARMLRLARGHDRRDSRLFDVESLLTDATLATVGIGIAFTLKTVPAATVLFALPLILIQRAAVLPTLRAQARRDAKTGLLNVRGFREIAEAELARARRFNRPLAVIMADLDNLRAINNDFGHLAGDRALEAVSSAIRAETRDYDVCARFGGD